jgi:hypothetical protein
MTMMKFIKLSLLKSFKKITHSLLFLLLCGKTGIEALINTIEKRNLFRIFLYKSIRHLWMGFYAGDETAGILINQI